MIPLGIAHLTALDLAPEEIVEMAARCGAASVGLRLAPASVGGIVYPVRVGSPAAASLKRRLADTGVTIHEVEFADVGPHFDLSAIEPIMELGRELGAVTVTAAGDDPEASRLLDNFAALCERADAFGLRVDLEFMRWRVIGTLAEARDLIERSGARNATILLDSLHFFRSGGHVGQLREVPAGLIRSVQLCDGPASIEEGNKPLIDEARGARLLPGHGQLPLGDFLASLPHGPYAFSIELPAPAPDHETRIRAGLLAARSLLDLHYRPAAEEGE